MPEAYLALENVTVKYGARQAETYALREVSVEFERGELTLIMGPSGSGKTTMLSLLGCLRTPEAGRVIVFGRDVATIGDATRTKLRQNLGFVFQAFRLFRAMSAIENIRIAAGIVGAGQNNSRKLLEQFGLKEKANLLPNELSGGEKQRVAIARALVNDPQIVLADEPTASLDSDSGHQIASLLRNIAEEQGRTVVVVSHDPMWETYAHRVVMLRDGKVIHQWRPGS
ncbi:MAG: ABC transporter ATP-binding protein [Acidobacteria bacterium]|nr:ABC transporter ATP-binding protein [Acidobacteriota bacterium]